MIELSVLNDYAKEFEGLEKDAVERLERNKNIPLHEQWLLKRFLDGYTDRIRIREYKEIVLIPTNPEVVADALYQIKAGIGEYFLNVMNLNLTVEILGCNQDVMYHVPNKHRKEEKRSRGLETDDFNVTGNRLRREGILPEKYICFVDNADFFRDSEDGRLTGDTSMGGGVMTILDRAIRKGRVEDNQYLGMNEKERIEYIKLVAAHEAYHLIGRLDDLEKEKHNHKSKGIPDRKDCLGYSHFRIPAKFCKGCVDGVIALWYGVQLRTGIQYINSKAISEKQESTRIT